MKQISLFPNQLKRICVFLSVHITYTQAVHVQHITILTFRYHTYFGSHFIEDSTVTTNFITGRKMTT